MIQMGAGNVNTRVGADLIQTIFVLRLAPKAPCHVTPPEERFAMRIWGIRGQSEAMRSACASGEVILSTSPPRPANGERIKVRGMVVTGFSEDKLIIKLNRRESRSIVA